MEDRLSNEFYAKYVGKYMKRFYQTFEEKYMMKIEGFELKKGVACFKVGDTLFDVEDSVIITDEPEFDVDDRVCSVLDERYKPEWYNPYN
jgi:hypothetical protein